MEILPQQLLVAVLFLSSACVIYKVKSKKLKVLIVVALALLFLFNPLRVTQKGGDVLERNFVGFGTMELPEKISVQNESWESKQKKAAIELQEKSEDYYEKTVN